MHRIAGRTWILWPLVLALLGGIGFFLYTQQLPIIG